MPRTDERFFALVVLVAVAWCTSQATGTRSTGENVMVPLTRTIIDEYKISVKSFSYVVREKRTNIPCILANVSIAVTLPYKIQNETSKVTLNVPKEATVTGNCTGTISAMKLSWKEKTDGKDEENQENVVTFTFIDDHKDFSVFSVDVDIYVDKKNFPNATDTGKRLNKRSRFDLRLFEASTRNGYHSCGRETKLTLDDAELSMKDVALVAFNTVNDVSSRKEEICTDKGSEKSTFPYAVKDEKGNACILAKMSIDLGIAYTTKDSKVKRGSIKVPDDVRVSGICESGSARLIFSWTEPKQNKSSFDSSEKGNSITFFFLKNTNVTYVYGILVDVYSDEAHFPNAKDERLVAQTPLNYNGVFFAPTDNGLYNCANKTTVNFNVVNMTIADVLLDVFDTEKDFASKKVFDCKSEFSLSEKNFNYVVRDEHMEMPCILANMTITMSVPYKTEKSKANATISVPSNARVSGICKDKVAAMQLDWSYSNDLINTIVFYVARNSSDFFVYRVGTKLYLDEKNFAGAVDETASGTTDYGLQLFVTPAQNGLYNCTGRTQSIMADDIQVNISNVAFVAFNTQRELSEKAVVDCSPSAGTTTPQPEPDPVVEKFVYSVTNPETNVPCILSNMSIVLDVTYAKKPSETKRTTLRVPRTAETSGECGNETSTMELTWIESTENDTKFDNQENTVLFTFSKRDNKFSLHAVNFSIYLDAKHFPDAIDKRYGTGITDLDMFTASTVEIYRCAPETSLHSYNVDMTVSNVALIAFNTDKSVDSRSEANCVTNTATGDNTGALVGGIFGALLAVGLIAFGVIWYRRRRRII